jgi:NADP-dependent 3-hydroxy acid dehydrogenase YdfG
MFANQGAIVVLVARRREQLDALADELTEFGVEALPIVCDITDQSQVNQAVDKACELAAAAVVGREFELLAPMTGLSEDH